MENGPFIDGLPIKHGDFPWLFFVTRGYLFFFGVFSEPKAGFGISISILLGPTLRYQLNLKARCDPNFNFHGDHMTTFITTATTHSNTDKKCVQWLVLIKYNDDDDHHHHRHHHHHLSSASSSYYHNDCSTSLSAQTSSPSESWYCFSWLFPSQIIQQGFLHYISPMMATIPPSQPKAIFPEPSISSWFFGMVQVMGKNRLPTNTFSLRIYLLVI